MDIAAIKDMNMNAVRMSHYPPDKEFLDLCDSLGLFVLDELTGWQKAYDTITGKKAGKRNGYPRCKSSVHCNLGQWKRRRLEPGVDGDYDWYDPQKRL